MYEHQSSGYEELPRRLVTVQPDPLAFRTALAVSTPEHPPVGRIRWGEEFSESAFRQLLFPLIGSTMPVEALLEHVRKALIQARWRGDLEKVPIEIAQGLITYR